LTPGSGMGKKSGSGMKNWVKILKFFEVDLGSGIEKSRLRDGKNSDPGINITDPQL
jgi:hypothetical protein